MNIDLNRLAARLEVLTLTTQQRLSFFVNENAAHGELNTPTACRISACRTPIIECIPLQKKRKFVDTNLTPVPMVSFTPRPPPSLDELLEEQAALEAEVDAHIERATAEVAFINAPRLCNELDWDDLRECECDSDDTCDCKGSDSNHEAGP
jgi:DNA-binding transcriptional regulator YdaS (Cro superfamily)